MKKSDLKKLSVGDRVVVSGKQDGVKFDKHEGTIRVGFKDDDGSVNVQFDRAPESWANTWYFYSDNARNFTITKVATAPKVEKPAKKRPHGAQEYKGNGKHAWENVTGNTVRLRVPGGWLYGKTMSGHVLANTTFVPVPQAVGYSV